MKMDKMSLEEIMHNYQFSGTYSLTGAESYSMQHTELLSSKVCEGDLITCWKCMRNKL